jgi:sugar O-acyltransferase (sialic acid O-acetyltransferase NeuD family)
MQADLTRRPLYIFGAGGHGKVVADTAMEAGWHVLGFLHDHAVPGEDTILDLPVLGGREQLCRLAACNEEVVIAIGDNLIRMQVQREFEKMGIAVATVVSSRAVVSKWAAIGRGTVVMPGAVVNAGAMIGRGSIINTGAVVEHDCLIGEFAHVSPNCSLGGGVALGELSQVGLGTAILPQVRVGARTVLGAGSVVNRDIPDDVVAYGVPARIRQSHRNGKLDSLLVLKEN